MAAAGWRGAWHMAAAGWRGAWRSRASSSSTEQQRRGGGDLNNQQRGGLVDFHYNCGMSTTTSGTVTTYTTSSSASYPRAAAGRVSGHDPLQLSPAAPPPVVEVEAGEAGQGRLTDQDKVKTREHVRDLTIGFRSAAGSGSDAMDKWLSELGVSWVLHLAQLEASARRTFISRRLRHTAHSWALALHMLSRSIVSFTGWSSSQQDQEESVWPPAFELAGFVAATFSKMLPFVDAVAALDISGDNPSSDDDDQAGIVSGHGGAVTSAHKFQGLVQVRDALSGASEQVQLWDSWLRSSSGAAEATGISGQMSRLLLIKLDNLDEAIRDTRDYIRTQSTISLKRGFTSASGLDASPGIHKVTRSVISYITVLSSSSYDSRLVDPPPIVSLRGDDVEQVPGDENAASSIHLIMLMMHSLEKKLTRASQSFPDPSLGYLFLLNNSYFVWHQLRTNQLLDAPMQVLARRIDGYINGYLQASWTPVLKPLRSPTLCCFMSYSSLREFESKFDKTYAAQKLWKVPDPELREELRTAIVDKVSSAFTRFLEDNGVGSSPELTPEKLQEMLEELFEG